MKIDKPLSLLRTLVEDPTNNIYADDYLNEILKICDTDLSKILLAKELVTNELLSKENIVNLLKVLNP